MQAHMSGQISGQVPNQVGGQLPGLPQQNGGSLSNQMQNFGAHRNTPNMDPELVNARNNMHRKIYSYLMQRQQHVPEVPSKTILDIVRRLEENLYRIASTKEEYMSMDTLESRLHGLIKTLPMSNPNQQQYAHQANSSAHVGTMIPTPGLPHSGNSSMNITSSVDTSMTPTNGGNNIATGNTVSVKAAQEENS